MQQQHWHWAVRACAVGVALMGLSLDALAVNKCTHTDGQVVYQDAPCSNAAKHSEQVKTWDNTPGSLSGFGSSGRHHTPAPRQIAWTGDVDRDLDTIFAEVEVTKLTARDCDWALKVERELGKCAHFVGRMRTGGEYQQTLDRLAQIVKGDQKPPGYVAKLNKMMPMMTAIQEKANFALAYMKSR